MKEGKADNEHSNPLFYCPSPLNSQHLHFQFTVASLSKFFVRSRRDWEKKCRVGTRHCFLKTDLRFSLPDFMTHIEIMKFCQNHWSLVLNHAPPPFSNVHIMTTLHYSTPSLGKNPRKCYSFSFSPIDNATAGGTVKLTCATSINDTSGKFATSVNDIGGKIAAGINDTGSKFATGVNDTGGK
jgi:hypothetical protein